MKVSSKSRYALMALVELDLRTRGTGGPCVSPTSPRERGIPSSSSSSSSPAFAAPASLAGHRGVGGGFTFARRPDQLTVLDVVEALDGALDARLGARRGLRPGGARRAPAPSGSPPAPPTRTCSPAPP